MDSLGVPFKAVPRAPAEEFLCPGSILEIQVTPDLPETWGMPAATDVMFANEMMLEPADAAGADVGAGEPLMKFGSENPLKSGWLRGPEHLYGTIGGTVNRYGKGKVVMLPVRVQRRAQTHGAYKLLFNPLMNSVLPLK
jgi:hypothetical protein